MKLIKRVIIICMWVLCLCTSVLAQEPKQLPDVTSTEGREYFVAWLPNGGSDPTSTDLKLILLASARRATTVVVEMPNGATQNYPIAAGATEPITVDPQTVYWNQAAREEEMALNKGIRVYSSDGEVFTLYSINQNGTIGTYSFDGAHILPVEALGTEYMVQTADADAIATEFLVMSTKPGATNVTINLKVNSRVGNTQQLNVTLNGPKQIYIVRSKAPIPDDPTDFIDLSGSTVCADQPIAVWSGNEFAVVPNQDGMNNDHAYDQLLPLKKWGKQFIVPMTACNTKLNILRIVAMQDNTNVSVDCFQASGRANVTLGAGETYAQRMVQSEGNPNPQNVSRFITADKPIQVYLYSSSAGANTWYDEEGNTRVPSDPSMTLIPPLEYLTDTVIFSTYDGGDGTLEHQVNLWALTSQVNSIRLDGQTVAGWKQVPGHTTYSQVTHTLQHGTHTIYAPNKCFSGFAYGINDGQAYLYPVGYNFALKADSLFLKGTQGQYEVHESDWQSRVISSSESGWYLSRILQEDGTFLLDTIFICDSTILTLPIKTYAPWSKVRWEIQGSIQGSNYFQPYEQGVDTTPRPELEHQFHLLPIEQNNQPFEDFEVRGILFHAPVFCEIPEDKWERDTFSTIVHVLRSYNDTTWRAICVGDTVQFFKDTVWKVSPRPAHPVEGTDYELQVTIFNDTTNNPSTGRYRYKMGDQVITRHYLSSGGCDSLSTLKLFVCSPHFEHKDTVVCQEGTKFLDYGDFFKRYSDNDSWPIADTVLYDTIRARDCMRTPEYREYRPHCPGFNGCDSVLELHLVVKKLERNPIRVNQCMSSGNIYEWREEGSNRLIHVFNADTMVKDSTYTFYDNVRYVRCTDCPPGGCDSVRNTLYLTFVTDDGQTHTVHICQGRDTTYTNMDFTTTFSSNGKRCNTPYEVTGIVHVYNIVDGQPVIQCQFEDRVTFWVDTVYRNQVTYDTICWDPDATEPQKYGWKNHPNVDSILITGPTVINRTDVLKTSCGCDSVCKLVLYVGRPYEIPTSVQISNEDSISWQDTIFYGKDFTGTIPAGKIGKQITTPSYYSRREMKSQFGCDSVLTLSLKIGDLFRDTVYDATCANCGIYNWVLVSPITGLETVIPIRDLPEPYEVRTYYDSLKTSLGFDSIYVLYLTGYPNYNLSDYGEVCQSHPYTWNGHMPTGPSGEKHRLFVNGQPVTEIPTETNGIIEVVDSMLTDTIYTNPKTGVVKRMQCDSVHTLYLDVHPTYNNRYVELLDIRTMASNDTISHFNPRVLYVGYDFDYAAHGTSKAELEQLYSRVAYIQHTEEDIWMDSVKGVSQYGCDSVRYVKIIICQVQVTTVRDSIGDNDSIWHFGGETAMGEHTLPLITGHHFHYYDDGTPVDYEQATGRQEREYFFIDTMRNARGCDSIIHCHLHVFPSYRFEFDTAICSNARYDWRKYTYLNQSRSGYVYDSVNYRIGTHTFDSVYVLGLQVVPSGYWQYDTILCMNDTFYWHFQKIYYQPGGLNYIEANYKDPDSKCGDLYHLNLQFAPYYGKEFIDHDTICQYDTYHWFTPGEINEHTQALRDSEGNVLTHVTTDISGDLVFYDSLKTVSCGCDSTYTLMLHIKPTYHFYDTAQMLCSTDTVEWRGKQFYYQGVPDVTDTVFGQSTVYGCDSNYYFKAHFDLSYEFTDSVFLCSNDGPFSWEDIVFDDTLAASHYWTEPRDYFITREYKTAISGCDSIRNLQLRIAPSYDSVWTDTICRGETYYLFDQRLTTPGEYTDVQLNQFGCSTYYYLTLKELPLTTFKLQVEPVCVDEDGMANTYLIHYTYQGNDPPISYSVRYDSVARSLGFEDEADIPIEEGQMTLTLPVPYFESRDQYPRPGMYDAVIAFKNGICLTDSLMTYPFVMEMRYPSWITAQHWNDAIFIMDSTLNGGYSFSAYQWYRNDSILHGETRPYLYAPQYLYDGARYSVALTRSDDQITMRTCPIIPNLNRQYDNSPKQTYISVVPTVVAKENPVVYILSPTSGTYKLINPQGQLVSQGAFTPDEKKTYPITLPATTGVYVFHLIENTTAGTGTDLSRSVKVIVQ